METSKKIDWKPIILCSLVTGLIGGVGTALLFAFLFFLCSGGRLYTDAVIITIASSLLIALIAGLVAGWANRLDQLD